VFPGGKVERADYGAAAASELAPDEARRLSLNIARGAPARLARGLAMAAIRETFEEAGLLLARPAAAVRTGGPWRAFHAHGALPDLAALNFIARAVTPPYRPRRFDARFFMADAVRLLRPDPCEACGELDELAWMGLDDTADLDLPAVTRFVLREVERRQKQPDLPVTVLRLHHGAPKLDQLAG
jgi:8-oxo-dGTP pyrophosphatase MutT (NUDIX family)